MLGYCTPDVLGQLEQAAHDVIVYEGPSAVERLRPPSSASCPAVTSATTVSSCAGSGWAPRTRASSVAGVSANEAADVKVDDSLLELLQCWYPNEREIIFHQLPERFLRRAEALLSPFDKGGLGTFDKLAMIPDVDDVYLFYEQLIFFRESRSRDE